jgi:gluconokinase
MQAVLEGVAYRFAAIFEQLCAGVCPLEEIIASGGALRESPVWTQIIADALGKTLTLPDTREASSRGAVLLVLETTGKIKNIAELKTDEGQIFTPDAAKHEIYKLAKRRQEDLYASVMKTKA